MEFLQRMREISEAAASRNSDNVNIHSDVHNRPTVSSSVLDKSVPTTDIDQQQWKPPDMVEPTLGVDSANEKVSELGSLTTDARLYVLREKEQVALQSHFVLGLPSSYPQDNPIHNQPPHSFNLLMVDVSASMSRFWSGVQDGWNNHVAPRLKGRSVIYTFGSVVTYMREGTLLDHSDFDAGGTDLTGALQTIVNEIYVCNEKYVNIFLITDGDHNMTGVNPSRVIHQMQAPRGKICNVYILGAGDSFPIRHSLNIRSRLHNGSSTLPFLFWAKHELDVKVQMADIGDRMSNGCSLTVTIGVAGSLLPGLPKKYSFHFRDWVYFACDPNQLKRLQVRFGRYSGFLDLEAEHVTTDVLEEIFCQWNSVIIQQNSKKESIPSDIFSLMKRIFLSQTEILADQVSSSINQRLQIQKYKALQMQFSNELNKLQLIINSNKFENQLELAENILSLTVTNGKYKLEYLQQQRITDKDYENDILEFQKVYSQYKDQIQSNLVTPEECCQITKTSTLLDLQDPDFLKLLTENDKLEFLTMFAISGIPVFVPAKDSTLQIPWAFSVQSVLKSPYTFMSQLAIKSFVNSKAIHGKSKMSKLHSTDANTHCNAIVPVFSPSVAEAMHPIVHTRLYSRCVSFALLNNPNIINPDMHVSFLATTWIRCLSENYTYPRSDHVQKQLESIESTAALYLSQPSYARYTEVLIKNPYQALVSDNTVIVDSKNMQCESLLKPLFLFYISQKFCKITHSSDVTGIIRLMIIEYIGRYLSKFKTGTSSYSQLFTKYLSNETKKTEWVKKVISEKKVVTFSSESAILKDFYTLRQVTDEAKKVMKDQFKIIEKTLTDLLQLKIDVTNVEELNNTTATGEVSWFTLKVVAKEFGLENDEINCLFSEESLFVYVTHALQYKSSGERLTKQLQDFSSSRAFVTRKIHEESIKDVTAIFSREFVPSMENSWLKVYQDVHSEVVKPMTRMQIVNEAQQRGISVTNETFHEVYKGYRSDTGLLRNACQTRACPYFLKPSKLYNEHAATERQTGPYFVHGLHKVAFLFRNYDIATAKQQLESGTMFKTPSSIPENTWIRMVHDVRQLQSIYQEITE